MIGPVQAADAHPVATVTVGCGRASWARAAGVATAVTISTQSNGIARFIVISLPVIVLSRIRMRRGASHEGAVKKL